ncbi:MurR/RpiR family transcriptional regulator [Streptomyces rapamycinicus]|uniref:Transcriptional regulator n=2 Tax=Streptomyces rapamycinicus TaxID=1226757 RepID=A0A0A0NAI5_STRRN|nr:MurR/RpiR family transcriptional regulator [Streptomyces rapamycinicus]AGP53919.1 transcriptional regulator [Streptomyces rapamycinicus NRRL 5491]MBB4781408.1 DNA-binding MurR/RpiR family transcriptional regulator [Streptomyces rapamycinicus]RLV73947.1 transcriptional regulator [Streptomyces rapamycinicus NRRL 5491]UTO62030.1 MurR/RpiR family transcriptional regulator [Streptomyces rapamycinicus]UTP29982.1 MurR/RpiR family transcriptional regulator [Streptomyces rapamycinicus NRRL 5491]
MSEPKSVTGTTRLAAAVRDMWGELSASERVVAQYLVGAPPENLLFASAQELGAASGTSNATVVRALQRLGYAGLPALKRELAAGFTSATAPEERLKQRIARVGHDLDEIKDRVFDEAAERLEQCRRLLETDVLKQAVQTLADAREVVAYGVGASELAARHVVLKLRRAGRRARFVGATGFTMADELLSLGRGDAVVILHPGRRLREFTVLTDRARAVGASVVLVTDVPTGPLATHADVVISAPHTPTGITAESLAGIVVMDALVLALASLDEPRAVEASHQLTVLRGQLIDRSEPRQRKS